MAIHRNDIWPKTYCECGPWRQVILILFLYQLRIQTEPIDSFDTELKFDFICSVLNFSIFEVIWFLFFSAMALLCLSHCDSFNWSLFYATLVCFFHSFNAGSILINPSDLYPQSSGFVFGIMNTAGAIPGFYFQLTYERIEN